MKQHFYFIINPKAGAGKGEKMAQALMHLLDQKQICYTTYYTKHVHHEQQLALELAQTVLKTWDASLAFFPVLVVLGGDGTLHNVVNALAAYTEIPIGYIPCGTGNDFARAFHLPRTCPEIVQYLLEIKQPQAIQLMTYQENETERIAVNNVGIGIDAHLVYTANTSALKKTLRYARLEAFSYAAALFKVFFVQKAFPVQIETETQTWTFARGFLCTITNHPYFGGGVAIAPTANPREPMLDLILIERIHLFKIIWLVIRILQKKHLSSAWVHHIQAPQLRIRTTQPQYIHADGEILGKAHVDMQFSVCSRLFWL